MHLNALSDKYPGIILEIVYYNRLMSVHNKLLSFIYHMLLIDYRYMVYYGENIKC